MTTTRHAQSVLIQNVCHCGKLLYNVIICCRSWKHAQSAEQHQTHKCLKSICDMESADISYSMVATIDSVLQLVYAAITCCMCMSQGKKGESTSCISPFSCQLALQQSMTLLSWTHCHPLLLLSHSRCVTARCLHQLILKAKLTFASELVCGLHTHKFTCGVGHMYKQRPSSSVHVCCMLQMFQANMAFIEWRP